MPAGAQETGDLDRATMASMAQRRFRPLYGMILVALFMGTILVAELALDGGFSGKRFQKVTPDRSGQVVIELSELEPGDLRFFRFLNPGNQEVKFFVARDLAGTVQVALDANEICYKLGRGYRHDGEWVTCNKCDKAFRIEEVNAGGGGCKPVPVAHRVEGERLILAEADVLAGWRYFR